MGKVRELVPVQILLSITITLPGSSWKLEKCIRGKVMVQGSQLFYLYTFRLLGREIYKISEILQIPMIKKIREIVPYSMSPGW